MMYNRRVEIGMKAFTPPRCKHVRKAKFMDILRSLVTYVDRRCTRYEGHENFGYGCRDIHGNRWVANEEAMSGAKPK